MIGLFHAHSGLRYVVFLAGIVALVVFAMGAAQKSDFTKRDRILGAIFVGLLDTQILVGTVLVVMGLYTPRVIGHIVMMILAAGLAHTLLAVNRRKTPPGHRLPLLGVGGALAVMCVGIVAIGRMPWAMTAFGG